MKKPNSESGKNKDMMLSAKMFQSGMRSAKELGIPSPRKELQENHYGLVPRDKLSLIFTDFISTYVELFEKTGKYIPSIFLLFSDKSFPKSEPVMYPLNFDSLDPKGLEKLDPVLEKCCRVFPASQFVLEMIIYSELVHGDAEGQSSFIMFGARDLGGAEIHAVYSQVHDKKRAKYYLNRVDADSQSLFTWIPPKRTKVVLPLGITFPQDTFLDALTQKYAVASSMSTIFPTAKKA